MKIPFKSGNILLPKQTDMTKWSVVACDQYTSEPEYWNSVRDIVGDFPSTLKLTLPEIYLEEPNVEERIKGINKNMEEFKARYGEENLKPYMHPLIRNHKACYKSTKKAVDLALETGANLHVLHLSTEDEIELFRPFADISLEQRKITAEACAHHLFFNDKSYERLGNRLKCNPAVKTEEDRKALISAVEQGIISIIATDHAPHTLEEKNQPFYKAPSGLPLIQYSLLAVLELVHRNELSLEAAVTALSHNPAVRFNIDSILPI